MSENIEVPQNDEQEFKVIMTIAISRDGRLLLNGNIIDDKFAAYGLLEAARDEIQEHHRKIKASMPIIKRPDNRLVSFLRNGHGKVG